MLAVSKRLIIFKLISLFESKCASHYTLPYGVNVKNNFRNIKTPIFKCSLKTNHNFGTCCIGKLHGCVYLQLSKETPRKNNSNEFIFRFSFAL